MSDDRALLLDPGGGLKRREAKGYLVLADRRLAFGTTRHGILVDLVLTLIRKSISVRHRFLSVHLCVESEDGDTDIFVTRSVACAAASVVNAVS